MSALGIPVAQGQDDGLDGVDALTPIGLAEVQELADLQTRVDLKYLVPPELVEQLTADLLTGAEVLTIDGQTAFGYESVYFDTPDLDGYLDAAHQRRRRFKVRTRTYLDSGGCVLEVKTRGGRGETVKERTEHDPRASHVLDGAAREFAAALLGPSAPVAELVPTLTT
ncbi:MAG: VTC domain-containing protein, partial [Cellulomonadaceae bacterium]|nr:VTC domain-containing protein [Cellulomonadaceae bacterium]